MRKAVLGLLCVLQLVAVIAPAGFAQRPSTIPVVRLRMALLDADDTAAPYRIRSDGFGDYTDGDQNVAATFDQYGNLIVDLSPVQQPALRTLTIDLSDRVDTGGPALPTNDSGLTTPPDGGHMATKGNTNGALQSMTVGTGQCVQLVIAYNSSSAHYSIGFHRASYTNEALAGTSYARVTRTGADTWEVEPVGCPDAPGIAKFDSSTVKGKTVWTDYGRFNLRFKFVLTRLV